MVRTKTGPDKNRHASWLFASTGCRTTQARVTRFQRSQHTRHPEGSTWQTAHDLSLQRVPLLYFSTHYFNVPIFVLHHSRRKITRRPFLIFRRTALSSRRGRSNHLFHAQVVGLETSGSPPLLTGGGLRVTQKTSVSPSQT